MPGRAPLDAGARRRFTRLLALAASTGLFLTVAQVPALPGATASARVVDVPGAPDVTTTPGYDLVTLTWPAVGDATSYTVFRGTAADALNSHATVAADGARTTYAYADRGVEPGATYFYAVSAMNAAGEGAPSAARSAGLAPQGVVVTTDRYSSAPSTPAGPAELDLAFLSPDGKLRPLIFKDASFDTPAVSPDGSTIAYMSDLDKQDGDFDLWIQRLGEEPVRRTSDDATVDAEPAFSPDGTKIAFTRYSASGPTVRIVPVAQPGWDQPISARPYGSPTWSPNGRLLAVVEYANPASETSDTWITVTAPTRFANGGEYHRKVSGTDSKAYAALDPSWSPDGSTLSFLRVVPGRPPILATVPATGGAVRDLTDGADMTVLSQQWAPGGRRIVFAGLREEEPSTLWSIDPAGGVPQAVPGTDTDAVLSPAVAEPAAAYVPMRVPPVTGLTARLESPYVYLSWKARPGAAFYLVRRSEPGGPAPKSAEDGVLVGFDSRTDASDRSVRAGKVYRYAVFAVSHRGDVSAAATRTVQPAYRPKIRPEGNPLAVLSGGGPKFVASWGKALPAGQSYEVQLGKRTMNARTKRWSAPVYAAFYTGRATTKVVPARAGTTYHLRVRVRDAAGNTTAWSTPAAVAVPYDDRGFRANGTWSDLTRQPGRFVSTVRQSKRAGSSLTLRQYGSSFVLIADRCKTCGKVQIYVDGQLVKTVDTYAKSTQVRQLVWSLRLPTIGLANITLVVAGTAKRPTVRIDGMIATR